MTPGGRLGAVAEIAEAWVAGRGPLDQLIRDWGRGARFAGSKDRSHVRDALFEIARRRAEFAWRMGSDAGRALAMAQMRWGRGADIDAIAQAAAAPRGPGPIRDAERASLETQLADPPDHVRAEAPAWCAAELERAFGEDWIAEAQAFQSRAGFDLRVNHGRTTVHKAQAALEREGVESVGTIYAPHGLRVTSAPKGFDLRASTAFVQGLVEPQDEGSQIAARLAEVGLGMQVVDLCAGGGGKTLALAADMGGSGQIYACDVDRNRLDAIAPRISRAKTHLVQLRKIQEWTPDAGDDPDLAELSGKADRVVIDAPCTGSGVWRRHPDAKWRLRPERLAQLSAIQDGLLRRGAGLVKPGGRLIYVTCSLFPTENTDRVAAFLARAPFAARPPEPERLREAPPWRAAAEGVTLTPRSCGTDGFFISIMERTA